MSNLLQQCFLTSCTRPWMSVQKYHGSTRSSKYRKNVGIEVNSLVRDLMIQAEEPGAPLASILLGEDVSSLLAVEKAVELQFLEKAQAQILETDYFEMKILFLRGLFKLLETSSRVVSDSYQNDGCTSSSGGSGARGSWP